MEAFHVRASDQRKLSHAASTRPRLPVLPFRPLSCPSHSHGGGKQRSELGAENPSPHPHPNQPHHRPLPPFPALRGHPHPLLPPLGLPSLPLPGRLLSLSFSSPPLVLLPLPLPRRPPRPPPFLLALQVPLPAAPAPRPLLRRRGSSASLGSRGAPGLLPEAAEAGPPRCPRPAYLGLRRPQPCPPLAALLGPHLAPSLDLKSSAHQHSAFTYQLLVSDSITEQLGIAVMSLFFELEVSLCQQVQEKLPLDFRGRWKRWSHKNK